MTKIEKQMRNKTLIGLAIGLGIMLITWLKPVRVEILKKITKTGNTDVVNTADTVDTSIEDTLARNV